VKDGRQAAGGYSFPAAMGDELWIHHITPTTGRAPLNDPRLAHLLNVPVGEVVTRRLRVTGPEGEPAFQISTTWIHPRISEEVPEIVRIGCSAKDEKAVDVTQVVIPGDRMEEVAQLRRDDSAKWPHQATGPDGPPVAPGP
jgi:GntR family transcriptional regulator